jgi:transcriptional regulator with XRE-family HTH domain
MTEIKRNTNNEKLIKAVNYLRLEFPVVEIAEKTGMDKGNISSYLNNKKSVSSNFIKKFEEAFNIDTNNFENKPEQTPRQNDDSLKDKLIEVLENQLRRLENALDRAKVI